VIEPPAELTPEQREKYYRAMALYYEAELLRQAKLTQRRSLLLSIDEVRGQLARDADQIYPGSKRWGDDTVDNHQK
jgi:hypothetical protein